MGSRVVGVGGKAAVGVGARVVVGGRKALSLVQMRSSLATWLKSKAGTFSKARALRAQRNFQKMSSFLLQTGQRLGPRATHVSLLAVRVLEHGVLAAAMEQGSETGVTNDAMKKVVGMIAEMIDKLKKEAEAEAKEHGYCTSELFKNKKTRVEKTQAIDELTAQQEELEAVIAKLSDKIAGLEKEEADLTQSMGEATEQRQAEKAKNTATIEDAKVAQDAVTQAVAVLREFYAKSGGGAALLQMEGGSGGKQAPEMKAYGGMSSSSGGILGMLEVILSDFTRLEADTTAAEAEAVQVYEEYMKDAEVDKETVHEDTFQEGLEKDRKKHALHLVKKDLRGLQEELDAANDVFDKLRPRCIDNKPSYEERVKAREQEIESLKNALEIMEE